MFEPVTCNCLTAISPEKVVVPVFENVDDACEIKPLPNIRRVEVLLPSVVGVHAKGAPVPTSSVPHNKVPFAPVSIVLQFNNPEMTRFVVEALVVDIAVVEA